MGVRTRQRTIEHSKRHERSVSMALHDDLPIITLARCGFAANGHLFAAVLLVRRVLEIRQVAASAGFSVSTARSMGRGDKARRDLARWRANREGHDLYAGVTERKVL
jgi:hypothetical protein